MRLRDFLGDGRPRRVLGTATYALTYAATVTTTVFAATAAVSYALGTGLTGVKYGLFVVGWLGFGSAALLLRPTAAWRRDQNKETSRRRGGAVRQDPRESRDQTAASPPAETSDGSRIRRTVAAVPPARWVPVDPADRPSGAVLLFVTACLVLATSLLLEVALGA